MSRSCGGPDGAHRRGEGHPGGGGGRPVADGSGQKEHCAQTAAGTHVESCVHDGENQRPVSNQHKQPLCVLTSTVNSLLVY